MLRLIFYLILFFIFPCFIHAQSPPEFIFNDEPLSGPFASKPGQYEIVVRNPNPIINPGETIDVELYLTGYGIIKSAKLYTSPSAYLFDGNKSEIIILGFRYDKKNEAFETYDRRDFFGKAGRVISFTGWEHPKWKSDSFTFDGIFRDEALMKRLNPQINTEMVINNFSPVRYKLKSKSKVKPGSYNIDFCLTYFNGDQWKISKQTVNFKIQNILQENEVLAWWVALVAAVSAIFASALTIINFFFRKNNYSIPDS